MPKMPYRNRLLLLLVATVLQLSAHAETSDWTLTTSDAQSTYVGTPVANGSIGLLPWREPFSVRHVVLNHVFDASAPDGVSQLLQGINPFLLTMHVDGQKVSMQNVTHWQQTVNMREATHETSFMLPQKLKVAYRICALRGLPYAAMMSVDIEATDDVSILLSKHSAVPSQYADSLSHTMAAHILGHWVPIVRTSGTSLYRKVQVAASSAFAYDRSDARISCQPEQDPNALTLKLKRGQHCHVVLLGAVCSSRDFLDPLNEADRQVIYALMEGDDALFRRHKQLWNDLWQSDIQIEGDPESQRIIRFALYNLYSYIRTDSGLSIPPMGLSAQGYGGHVFWDAELWMLPPLLYLQPAMARQMVDYRYDRLTAARRKAWAYGYQGAMFPWESDDLGEEACPTYALTGPKEHHVTADVALAAWQYFLVSRDTVWLRQKGWPLLQASADFWMSRATRNADQSWSIHNVVCADEYAEGVSDNAFTNGIVRRSLEAATQAARLLHVAADHLWQEAAANLRFLKLPSGVTSEYDGYHGQTIKQADANLLGYPLCLITDTLQLRTDLEYYSERIDQQNGPAMSYAIFSVQYARLGDADRAWQYFRRSYEPHLRPPFGVLAETPTSQNPYFATGAGGLLQSVICGFAGLQITPDGIRQLPSTLPRHWRKLTIKGVGKDRKTFVRTPLK